MGWRVGEKKSRSARQALEGVWGERDIYAKRFSLAITDSEDAV